MSERRIDSRASKDEIENKSKYPNYPYIEVIKAMFAEKYPDQAEKFTALCEQFSRQALDNMAVFKSERFNGSQFAYTDIRITSDLVQAIAHIMPSSANAPEVNNEGEKQQIAESVVQNEVHFMYSAFGGPDDMGPVASADMAWNDFMRGVAKVHHRMLMGDKVPEVRLVLVGSPTGPGGKISDGLDAEVHARGLDGLGELNAEFIGNFLQENNEDLKNTAIRIHGVSRGSLMAAATGKHLSEAVKKKTKLLLDNPVGRHERDSATARIDGIKVLGGIIGEGVARAMFNRISREAPSHSPAFMREQGIRLSALGVTPDDEDQKRRKMKLTGIEGIHLLIGNDIQTDRPRTFIRQEIKDPLTTGVRRVADYFRERSRLKKAGIEDPRFITVQGNQPHVTESLTSHGTHFWSFQEFDKWNRILQKI